MKAIRAPGLSVVIVHQVGADRLALCLQALQSQTSQDFEIVLVGNGPQARLGMGLAEGQPRTQRVRLPRNVGFAAGANAGLASAVADRVAFLNDDTVADPGWVEALLQASEAYPWADCFASRMLQAPRGRLVDSAGDVFTRFGEGAGRGHDDLDGEAFDQDREVFGASAGAALYRRGLLDRLGGFDSRYFHTAEDVDLAVRSRMQGARCVYVARARVLHAGGATRNLNFADAMFYQSRNTELVYWSNLPTAVLLRTFPWHVARGVWGLWCRSRAGQFRPYLRGKLSGLGELRRLFRQRSLRLDAARVTADEFWKAMDPTWHRGRLAGLMGPQPRRMDIESMQA